MRVQKKARMFNFLIELLISIVFFAFASIVCVQLFASGNRKNVEALELSNAMILSENVAEKMRVYNGEKLADYLGFDDVIYFDENYNISEIKSNRYLQLKVDYDINKTKYSSNISYYFNDKVLLEYNVMSYPGGFYEE